MDSANNEEMIVVTASLTKGGARVTHGIRESVLLVDEILVLDHDYQESCLYIGDHEFYQSTDGPIPDHQMRVSVRPSSGVAALNHMDQGSVANSHNPQRPPPPFDLIFNGKTGMVFPRTALISVSNARRALIEWLQTRRRPSCIEWRSFDPY
nr:Imm1 family immunity protein [Kibdelosporangium sp. MJ126-NF4]